MIYKDVKINIPNGANYIISTLNKFNYEAYIVGGAVRDSVLGKVPNDYDITTNALPEEIERIFNSLKIKTIPTGIKHGTITVLIEELSYEVTTFRIDGEYRDNRRPEEVIFTSFLQEDLKRRDFTINAMAYNKDEGLIDYFNGVEDLKKGVIKAVGEPLKRFSEDALRMMRTVRFSAQLGFSIDKDTEDAIINLSHNIKYVSIERIREEFNKILLSSNPNAIDKLSEYGLIQYFIPQYKLCECTLQNNPHHIYNVAEHIISSVGNVEQDLPLRLTMFLHDIGKPECKTTDEKGVDHFYCHAEKSSYIAYNLLKEMKYDNKTIDKVITLIKYHDSFINNTKGIKKLLNKIGEDNFRDLLKVRKADILAQNPEFIEEKLLSLKVIENKLEVILKEEQCFKIKDLKIRGLDLINIGIEGKNIGIVLKKLLDLVIDDYSINYREKLLELAKKLKNELL
ncbi:CCA tRNA nucleotidyltransferase [Hathewaya histolytica]|uniref:Poly(A) polymerase n=1 Tax=Hathewaya histolytica TaxID=1498 RepID=A0A4U9R9R8_HATHI|nr:CCA tRNA nucleotidyltransferase [Hathewaya histolytica]VTQ88274.1 poly(A) polymerase [Hathewaya histolytica]